MKNITGKILQELLQKEGAPSVKDFASMMGMSSRTLYNLFEGKSSLTIEQLIKASQVLNYNIVEDYLSRLENNHLILQEPPDKYSKTEERITVSITISATPMNYSNFGKLLAEFKNTGASYGFKVL